MDILKLGVDLLMNKLSGSGANVNESSIMNALTGLLGGTYGQLDIASLVAKFSSTGMFTNIVSSWLGNDENAPISADNIKDVLGHDAVSSFASKLGVGEDEAANGLAGAIPEMVDKSSNDGSLLDSVGGMAGAVSLAKGLFG